MHSLHLFLHNKQVNRSPIVMGLDMLHYSADIHRFEFFEGRKGRGMGFAFQLLCSR